MDDCQTSLLKSMFLIILICSQAKTHYIAECGKLGVTPQEDLVAEATKVADISRAVTLEGHYIRVIQTKKKEDRVEAFRKYMARYAAVKPDDIHPLLRQEVEKTMENANGRGL